MEIEKYTETDKEQMLFFHMSLFLKKPILTFPFLFMNTITTYFPRTAVATILEQYPIPLTFTRRHGPAAFTRSNRPLKTYHLHGTCPSLCQTRPTHSFLLIWIRSTCLLSQNSSRPCCTVPAHIIHQQI